MAEGAAFRDYLEAKIPLDSRSLNPAVLRRFRSLLEAAESPSLLDVGTGTAAMLRRVLEWELRGTVLLCGVDSDPENLQVAGSRLADRLGRRPWTPQPRSGREAAPRAVLRARRSGCAVAVELREEDLLAWMAGAAEEGAGPQWPEWVAQPFQAVTAQAFMDLMPLAEGVRFLAGLLVPGGLFYSCLNYDGLTVLLPPAAGPFEEALLRRYDRSMEARREAGLATGGSRSGRRLFAALLQEGFELLEVGGADWTVFPRGGTYAGGDGTVLRAILGMIRAEGRRDVQVAEEALQRWYGQRLSDLESGRLALVVHHLDILARRP